MLKLPALTAEELDCIRQGLPASPQTPEQLMTALAERVRQHLRAALGVPVGGLENYSLAVAARGGSCEPAISIAPALASAWVELRFGGSLCARMNEVRDPGLIRPMRQLVRRALAETVVNAGREASIPQAMGIGLRIGPLEGSIEIVWNCPDAQAWARRAMRTTA